MCLIDTFIEPQAFSGRLVRRIPQHQFAAADKDRNVCGRHSKAIEQLLSIGLSVEVDVRVRMPVPDQELLDAQRTGAVGGTNKDHIAVPSGNQLHAPKDECPHEDFAQLGVVLHERQELFAIQFDHFAGFADPRSRQRAGR